MCIQHQPFTYITITTALYIQRITNAVADCTRKTEKSVGEFFHSFFFSSYSFLPFLFLFRLSLDRRDYYIGKRYKGREYHNNYRNITKKYSASKKIK